jgi:hypothetical protein
VKKAGAATTAASGDSTLGQSKTCPTRASLRAALVLGINYRPTWLRNTHAALDWAVWGAHGWPEDEIPGEVEEDVILSRLLALNEERAGTQG